MKQKYQIIINRGLLSILALVVIGVQYIYVVHAADPCSIQDFTSGAVAEAGFSTDQTKVEPDKSLQGTVAVTLSEGAVNRCKEAPVFFLFIYTTTGKTTTSYESDIHGEFTQDAAGAAGFHAEDQSVSWNQLTGDAAVTAGSTIRLDIYVHLTSPTPRAKLDQAVVSIAPKAVTPRTPPKVTPPPTTPPTTTNSASGDCKQFGDGYVTISGTSICVPKGPGNGGGIAGSDSIFKVIATVIRILLILSGVLAVLFVIIGGFWYLTSAGNEEQAAKGRKALTYAILGLIIIVLSYSIVAILVRTLTSTPEQIISGGGGSSTTPGGPGDDTSPGGGPPDTTPPNN